MVGAGIMSIKKFLSDRASSDYIDISKIPGIDADSASSTNFTCCAISACCTADVEHANELA